MIAIQKTGSSERERPPEHLPCEELRAWQKFHRMYLIDAISMASGFLFTWMHIPGAANFSAIFVTQKLHEPSRLVTLTASITREILEY